MWLALQMHLKVRNTMRRYAVPVCYRLKQERESILGEWLRYWRSCEAKCQEVVRIRRSSVVSNVAPMTLSTAQSLARALVSTPEGLKAVVVWDLYWLLRAQHSVKALAYWRRWYALQWRRAELRNPLVSGTSAESSEWSDVMDATHMRNMSLPTVNAAIFLMILQPPRFDVTPGKHINVQDLVRLANRNLNLDFAELGDVSWAELRRIPPTVPPFLSSPLCADPGWIRQRCLQPIPIIPHSAAGGRTPSRPTSAEFPDDALRCFQSLPLRHDSPMLSRPRMPPLCQSRRTSQLHQLQQLHQLHQLQRLPLNGSGAASPNGSPLGSPGRVSPLKPISADHIQPSIPHKTSRQTLPPGRVINVCGEPLEGFPSHMLSLRKCRTGSLPSLTPIGPSAN
eukprot:EG_transcript_6302